MCRLLEDEALQLWKRWLHLFIADQLKEHNGFCFNTKLDLIVLLSIMPNWDTIVIEEKDDQNQMVESTIRIPSQPSVLLQEFLFNSCDRLEQIVSNALSKPIIALLTDILTEKLRPTYRELLASHEFLASNQHAALQFYFDMKFLHLLFGFGRRSTIKDDKHDGTHDFSSLADEFKAHIDPFDFEMFHKYINANVKKSIQRMRHMYGSLVANSEHLNATATATSATSQDKEPNVLALSVGVASANMFPLLPIVTANAAGPAPAPAPVVASPTKQSRVTRSEKVRRLYL